MCGAVGAVHNDGVDMAAFCGARNKQFEVGIVARKAVVANG